MSNHLKAFGIGMVLAILGIAGYMQYNGTAPWQSGPTLEGPLPTITVYKSPTCGCCNEWITHLQEEGFEVKPTDVSDTQSIKQRFGVPRGLTSCHTGVVNGYVVEGHVPADEVKRLLATKPDVAGITVPGMPIGSPGMEQGDRQDPYNVIAFTKQGTSSIFARYHQ